MFHGHLLLSDVAVTWVHLLEYLRCHSDDSVAAFLVQALS
jgi:hypothetical protein